MPRWFFLLVSAVIGLAVAGSVLIILRSSTLVEESALRSDGKLSPQPCEPQNTVGKVVLPDCPTPEFPTPRTP
jgi:hypothetical protein